MNNKVKAFYQYNPLDKVYASVPQSVLDKYQTTLPKFLIEIWQYQGLSVHKDGFFWLVNPEEYQDIIHQFIPNKSLLVLIRTAFGGLIYFDEKGREKYNYLCPIYLQVTPLTSSLDAVMNGWLTTEEIYTPLMFYNLYIMARQHLPQPKENECFGFLPAIALGGDMDIDNIKLFKLKEHLAFLSQLG